MTNETKIPLEKNSNQNIKGKDCLSIAMFFANKILRVQI